MRTLLTAFAAALLIAAGTASADLLAYEGFDGYSAGNLHGQGSPSGSETGYAGTETWNVQQDSSVDGWKAETGGLSYGTLVVNGGNAQAWRGPGTTYNDPDGASAELDSASPLSGTTQTEFYFSALINADNLQAANFLQVAWDHLLNEVNQRLFGFELRGSNQLYALAGTDSGGAPLVADTGLTLAAGTNLLVLRATDGSPDTVELWLNPDPAAGDPGTADWSDDGMFALTTGDSGWGFDGFYLHEALNNSSSGSDGAAQSAQVDELRFGESYADVTPIPEPATMSLLGLGGLALLRRRRR